MHTLNGGGGVIFIQLLGGICFDKRRTGGGGEGAYFYTDLGGRGRGQLYFWATVVRRERCGCNYPARSERFHAPPCW